jgi:hypothetical protein
VAYVKEQRGHASIAITVDIYGHAIPNANRAAVERLAGATGAARTPGGATVEEALRNYPETSPERAGAR